MAFLPRERSIKNTGGDLGGVEPELATDCFFDFRARSAIVLRQLRYRLTGFVTLGDYASRDAGAGQYRPTEGT